MKHSRVWPISLSLWPSISVTRKESPFVLLFVLIILNPRQAEVIPFLSVACRQHINPLIQFLSAAVAWANVLSYCREKKLKPPHASIVRTLVTFISSTVAGSDAKF